MPTFATLLICALFGLQDPARQNRDLVDELLDLPAPAADWTPYVPVLPQGTVPPDEAPISVLLAFWSDDMLRYTIRVKPTTPTPTERTRIRLLVACEQEPERLRPLLDFLPENPGAHDRVLKLLEAEAREPKMRWSKEWCKAVREWLMLHSLHFREDLTKAAQAATFKEHGIDGAEELAALTRLDWERAKPILDKHSAEGDPRLVALALSLRYRHAPDAARRDRLKAIAADAKAPVQARNLSIGSIVETEWTGREPWFLGLFEDATLREGIDGGTIYFPLPYAIRPDPDLWIPIVARKVGNPNRAVHDAAVTCLIQFHGQDARKDALRPLLPWLDNPEWSSARDRLRLLQSLDRVDLPESVPALIWVVDHSSYHELSGAAEALAVYRDLRAIPALRRAIGRAGGEYHQRSVVKALLALDGLSDDEIVRAVEAYADQISTEKGREEVRRADEIIPKVKLRPEVGLGMQLAWQKPSNEAVHERLLSQADALDRKKPDVARSLRGVLYPWPYKAIDRYIARRLMSDRDAVTTALGRRGTFRGNVESDLPAGIGGVILEDKVKAAAILAGEDRPAQRALLACARLVRDPLPLDAVEVLLKGKDPKLALAAERYLESEDSPAAQKLVLERHPGEVRILGALMSFDPGHVSFGELEQWENRLRAEMREKDAPDELHCLLSAGYWGSAGQVVVRVRGTRAEATSYGSKPAEGSRELSAEELQELRAFLASERIDELPPLAQFVADGMQYEYMHLRREGGRRVFMNNPGTGASAFSVYDRLARLMSSLASPGK